MKRIFKLEYDWWSAIIEIDESIAAPVIKESVEFWSGWVRKIANNKGDYSKTFVENLSTILIEANQTHGVGWLKEEYFIQQEGYCFPLDGSNGIELLECDEWSFDSIEVSEKEVSGA